MGIIAGQGTNIYNASLNAAILPAQLLGRALVNTAPTYVWNQTSPASFAVASNWTPARTSPTAKDVLQFSAGGSVVVNNVPTQAIDQLQVLNNSTVELQSATSTVLTVSNMTINAGSNLKVGAGSQITVATTLTNNGNVSLLSDNTKGTASLLTPATLAGTGTYNIQQYLTDGLNCHISSPVTAASISACSAGVITSSASRKKM